jgi:GNAT superfamily N-acetyltransferase
MPHPSASFDGVAFTRHDDWPDAEARLVDAGLEQANQAAAPLHEVQPMSCFARGADGQILGGALGRRWAACCELQQLWVLPSVRHRGLGARLVREFESMARQSACTRCYLETFSFQAPAFYRALGYTVTHRHDGFPHGIVKLLMERSWADASTRAPAQATSRLRIRTMCTDDLAAVTALRLALLQETGTTEGDVRPLQQVTQDFFQRSLDSADWQTWVAEAPGSPAPVAIGTMALWLRPPYPGNPGGLDAYLLNMYTAPAQRGQGAARGIVAAALEWARQRGVPKVVLHATAQGRALYEAFGFTGSAAYMECRLEPAA